MGEIINDLLVYLLVYSGVSSEVMTLPLRYIYANILNKLGLFNEKEFFILR